MIENIQTKTRYEIAGNYYVNKYLVLLAVYVRDRMPLRKTDVERHYHADYFVKSVISGEEFWIGVSRVSNSKLLSLVNC